MAKIALPPGFGAFLGFSVAIILACTISVSAAPPPPPPPDVAQSGITGTGQPPTNYAGGAAVIPAMSIQTFSGVSGTPAAQNTQQLPTTPAAFKGSFIYQPDSFSVIKPGFFLGFFPTTTNFGTTANAADQVYETWNPAAKSILIGKPGGNYSLVAGNLAGAFTDTATGGYFPGGATLAPAGERLFAKTMITAAAPANTRSGARVVDPYPIAATSGVDNQFQQYPYAANIGGMDQTGTDDSGNPIYTPTMLSINGPGQMTAIEFFADDSNDPTFATTQSNPIWDFAIMLDTEGGAPRLSADFSYDSSRLTISGATTGSALLNYLMSQSGVSYTVTGADSATFTMANSVDLFNGTGVYTANLNSTSADPNMAGDIDFSFGTASVTVPEPSGFVLLTAGGLMLMRRRMHVA